MEDVFEIRAAPRVDALGVIPHHHHIAVVGGESVDEFGLEAVGILVFIDEDVLELMLVVRGDIGVGGEKREGFREEVIEVQRVCLALAGLVGELDFFDVGGERDEVAVFSSEHLGDRRGGVDRVTENIREHAGLREFAAGIHEAILRDDGCDHVLGVLAVHDGEAFAVARFFGVSAEDAVADRVECAAPEAVGAAREEALHALDHFAGCLVGEGEEEDGAGGDALFQEPRDAVGERACFATACAGNHE